MTERPDLSGDARRVLDVLREAGELEFATIRQRAGLSYSAFIDAALELGEAGLALAENRGGAAFLVLDRAGGRDAAA